jgi:hypothetical protein
MIKNFEKFLIESINEKIKLKVLLVCGSPLAGKSTIINKLSYIPFHNIDMDKYIKLFFDKKGLDLDMRQNAKNLETALKRNLNRERKIPENVIQDMNYKSKNNIRIYKNDFEKFWLFNTITDDERTFKKIESEVRNFFYSPVQNPIGQQILKDMKSKNLKYLSQLDADVENIDFFK